MNLAHFGFTVTTVAGAGNESIGAASAVAALNDRSESDLLEKLLGEKERPMREADGMETDEESSGLSQPPGGEDEEEKSDSGRPNFKRATPGSREEGNAQEFFGREKNRMTNDTVCPVGKSLIWSRELSAGKLEPAPVVCK
jgi:hypothetical protein